MELSKKWVVLIVFALLGLQAAQIIYVVHRESLSWDEGDHMFAGYMMIHARDYGLNPEHPPLVKLLAAVPLIRRDFWNPPSHDRNFKGEAYFNGRDWLARNDGASQRIVFQMRMAAALLAFALTVLVFFAAREWFGTLAGLIALILVVFDPNILANSGLVTTDIGVSLFFLASLYAFYRYVKQPTSTRLLLAGVVAGFLLATKHSGVLLAPMLLLLIACEIASAAKGSRGQLALRLAGALAAIVVIGVCVLWAFYGFRYAARPVGLTLNPSLVEYAGGLRPFDTKVILAIADVHLLPESYLMGLTDVKLVAQGSPSFALGRVYSHGVWWYFPVALLIKSTLGLLALVSLCGFAVMSGRLHKGRELIYIVVPGAAYLAASMMSGLNIGIRHVLPLLALAAILAAAGLAALVQANRRWAYVGGALVLFHVVSALSVFPNPIAYANEAWGGPRNLHNLLTDSNVDWGQQLIQVKEWQDRHPGEECWFAYFVSNFIEPSTYGIRCHVMPTSDTGWTGGSEIVPPVIHGNLLISAGDLSYYEAGTRELNPYRDFQSIEPTEMIDYGVLVYRGDLDIKRAAALSRVQNAYPLLWQGKREQALVLAREASTLDPEGIDSQTLLGDVAAGMGLKDEARKSWQAALVLVQKLEPDLRSERTSSLEEKLRKL